jgi:predicted amidohydrolase
MTTAPYKALAMQLTCQAVNHVSTQEDAQKIMLESLQKIELQIKASKNFIGNDLRLIVFPEYFLTGFPMGESIEIWQKKACLDTKSEVFQKICSIAQANKVYLSGNFYELDEHFPNLYFQTSFIIDDNGNLILKYRRLNSMFAPTPHDVWDKYLEIYGYEAVFPVVDTPLGKLACIASEEILYPEIARCLMVNGAEVFLHSSSEISSNLLTQKNVAKLARAIENMAYVISANSAGIANISIPFSSTDGQSKIVNYEGLVLSEAGYGESIVANSTIHIEALRNARGRVGMSNFIARQRFELYAPTYSNRQFYPVNNLLNIEPSRQHFIEVQKGVIEKISNKN